jgi:predicted ArsR family transcriptional regulator
MAKHELLRLLHQKHPVHAKDVAEHWDITESGARASLHHLRRNGLVRQVWMLTDQGKARLEHFDTEGCASPEYAWCRTEKKEDVLEWLFGH